MRDVLRQLFLDALRALDLPARMNARIRASATVLQIHDDLYALDQYRHVKVIAFGKAAAEMTGCMDEILGRGRANGIVVSHAEPRATLPNFQYITGGHPYPNEQSLQAAEAALRLAAGSGQRTLLLFLISGGGSAVLEKPLLDDIDLEQLREFNRVLVTCGANIREMNVVRKHFSAIKGGRLGVAAHPARQATVFVSDVPEDAASTVASGPTMPDETTVAECLEIAGRYGLAERLPEPYARRLRAGDLPETPKPGDPRFADSCYYPVLSNADGIEALLRLTEERGWQAEADTSCDDWPLEEAADHLLQRLAALRTAHGGPVCIVSGGELSSPVTGNGSGGRNQAFVLYCAMRITGQPISVMSGGTDGGDGNSPAAGAAADGATAQRAVALGLDPGAFYRNSDSYTFFSALGDEIVTGPTGNNVRDLRVLISY